jgi:hypothetical protein
VIIPSIRLSTDGAGRGGCHGRCPDPERCDQFCLTLRHDLPDFGRESLLWVIDEEMDTIGADDTATSAKAVKDLLG